MNTNITWAGAPTGAMDHVPAGQGLGYDGPVGAALLDGPAETGAATLVVPGLIVFDVSYSMERDLQNARQGLEEFTSKLRLNGAVSPYAYLGIATFADTARTDLPLTRLADPSVTIPEIGPRGSGTNYDAAFREALSRFRTDLPLLGEALDGTKRKVMRPTIYFVSDGQSNCGGDYRAAVQELKSRSWAPNIVTFGFGDADTRVLEEIASPGMAYVAANGQRPADVVDQILKVILQSVVTATMSATTGVATAPVVDPQTDPATRGLVLMDAISSTID